ncbi:MAG: asparaginase [Betaproteobacteria bacterium]|nr:MAG: asparaginase [Betaproteobacteria bacterium]
MQPRIAVIGMGGSISTLGRHKLDLFEYGQFAKPLQVEDVLGMFSDVLVGFDVVPVPFRAIDSATVDLALWLELNGLISRVAADGSIAGIVILHGTSTLEETAYFLHLTVKVATPIVLVGAQRPPNGLGSDAGINLVNALRVAAAREARGLGVDPDGAVAIYRLPARRHAPDTEFDVSDLQQLPSVEIVYSYAGASARAIEAFVEDGVKGIVVAGMPPGRASPAQRAALIVAAKRGVLVVQCSRAGSGRVIQRSEDREAGFVAADNLNPQKARVLAMLALCCTDDRAAIARMFIEY